MRRLDYHVTVQSDEVVRAILTSADGETTREKGRLDLSDLETITQDYLPHEGSPERLFWRTERTSPTSPSRTSSISRATGG